MSEIRSLEALQARFFDGLGLPEWQREVLQDPRMNPEVASRLLLAAQLAGLQDAVLALVAAIGERPDEED